MEAHKFQVHLIPRHSSFIGSEKIGRKGVNTDLVRSKNVFHYYKNMRKLLEKRLNSQKEIEWLMIMVKVDFDDNNKSLEVKYM